MNHVAFWPEGQGEGCRCWAGPSVEPLEERMKRRQRAWSGGHPAPPP